MSGIPQHKLINAENGYFLLVDGFQYAGKAPRDCTLFFLTHAHSDHYTGIKPNWEFGTIYCSETTAKLVSHLLGVDPSNLSPLPMNTPVLLGENSGVEVTLIDANHCPGAVQFLFKLENGKRIVHTGDFRFSSTSMLSCPLLSHFRGADALYLDTTYLNPRFTFPSQEESVEYVANTIFGALQPSSSTDCSTSILFLISTYVIGKERILQAVAERCGVKLYVSDRKAGVMACLGLPDWMFTTDPNATPVHIVPWNFLGDTWPYFRPNWKTQQEYVADLKNPSPEKVIGFVPTGWVHGMAKERFQVRSKGTYSIHLVPYSEHSSYQELMEYVSYLRPVSIIPTVGCSDEKAVSKMLKHFSGLVDEAAAKSKFLSRLQSHPSLAVEPSRVTKKDGSDELPKMCKPNHLDAPSPISLPCSPPAVERTQDGRCSEAAVHTLRQLSNETLSIHEAKLLLHTAGGDLGRAADAYFAEQGPSSSNSKKRKMPEETKPKPGQQRSILSFFGKDCKTSVKNDDNANSRRVLSSEDTKTGQVRNEGVFINTATTGTDLCIEFKPEHDALLNGAPISVALPLDRYDPVDHAPWQIGQPTPYLHLARTFETMESTTKRLKIGDALVNMFRSVLALTPEDLPLTAFLAVGKIAPDYEGIELSIGGSTVASAISEATGLQRNRLHEMYNQLGDLGDVAAACKKSQSTLARPAPLTVRGVFGTLRQIAMEKGQGSSGRRQRAVLSLIRSCRESEIKYLVRTLVQALRVGANWRSVIPALAKAIVIHEAQVKAGYYAIEQDGVAPNSGGFKISDDSNDAAAAPTLGSVGIPSKAELDAAGHAAVAAFHMCPDLKVLIEAMRAGPMDLLQSRCPLKPGIPIKPMLAKISEGIEDALAQLKGEPFLCERKYDGVRAQIHVLTSNERRCVKVFSRNCEDRTASFPDVVAQVLDAVAGVTTTCILDAEVVAVDRKEASDAGGIRIRPFQDLSSRPRAAVDLASLSIEVCIFVFDIIEWNGTALLTRPFSERRKVLVRALPNLRPGYVELAQGNQVVEEKKLCAEEQSITLVDRMHEWLLEALAAGTEGLMLKSLAAKYEPSRRSDHWIKLKKDYCSGLHDTLDLVVIGAWHGSGRKAGWYSPFLMAAWDPDKEEFQSICRCMSGFSDDFYKAATARLTESIIPNRRHYYNTREVPDVWFDAKEVWEIRGADLTLSPVHRAALGRIPGSDRGIGLRFPRFVGVREDKEVEDATTAETIATMYQAQERKVERAVQALGVKKREQE